MTTITGADYELDELKKFYQFELDKTVKQVENLQSIIQKLIGQTCQFYRRLRQGLHFFSISNNTTKFTGKFIVD